MRALLASLAVGSIVLACGGTSPGTTSADTSSCDSLASSAREEVEAAFTANADAACSTDADCETFGLRASCFDSCGRTAAKSAQPAIEAAQKRVDAAQCAKFTSQGCKAIIPPCVAPTPPACVGGKCR